MKIITFGAATHVGMVRSENQDSYAKFPPNSFDLGFPKGQLFVVADGMGGHAGGREASKLAVETIGKSYYANSQKPSMESLSQSFKDANEAIYQASINDPRLFGMGTTCVALALHNDSASIAHVGDSKLYRITKSSIEQLTNDHSTVAEMVRRGIITIEESKNHPQRSQLYRAMGLKAELEFDVMNRISIKSDEYFLLCTDGLANYVGPQEMQRVVLRYPARRACEKLIELANSRGGHDNITVEIVHVTEQASLLERLIRGIQKLVKTIGPTK